jgi:hypothetical protein
MRDKTPGERHGHSRLAYWTLALALICGGVLRWVWIEDMEWKQDERWSYRMSQEVGRVRPWPSVGMPTSLGFPNPGLSVWVFAAMGRLAHSPTSMARGIVLLNMIGLIGFAAAVRTCLPALEREPWLWGLALAAVSPFAIRMSRKLWPQSILTPILLLLWVGHRHRQTRSGAVTWGIVGALIGQLHLSGWFVAAGLAIGTAVGEWRGVLERSRRWRWWLLGSMIGLASAIPWARALATLPVPVPAESATTLIVRLVSCLYELVSTSTSVRPYSALGLGEDALEYEVSPIIGGLALHVPDVLDLFIASLVIVRIAVRLVNEAVVPGFRWIFRRINPAPRERLFPEAVASDESPHAGQKRGSTGFYLCSTIAIPCAIYVLTTQVYFYHYFFVMFPFVSVLLAVCVLPWRRALLALVIAQALLALAFVGYIHYKTGTIRGEYGLSYARQRSIQFGRSTISQ